MGEATCSSDESLGDRSCPLLSLVPAGCRPSTDQRACESQPVRIRCQPRPQTCVLGYWSTTVSHEPASMAGRGGGPVGRIVVGVDASPDARRALAWAAAEARLRQAVLQVGHAYHAKNLAAPVYFGSQHTWDAAVGAAGESQPELTVSVQRREAFEEAVRSQADELLEALLGELGETSVGSRCSRRWWRTDTQRRRWCS